MPLTQVDQGLLSSTAQYTGFKNRIINGAMVIDQRNAGASVTPASGDYLVDRFLYRSTIVSKFTAQQNAGSVTPPAGFTNYLGMTSTSAYSVGSGDRFNIGQRIEGYNAADLGWGAAGAATVTLSFQVYSSLTGTFGGALQNSAANRSYPFTYTVSAANTWTSISVTIPGDTSGTWLKTNGTSIEVYWGLGCGSTTSGTAGAWAAAGYFSATGAVSVVGTNGATFYITGVQLEKGSTATSFDYRPYGTEFQLCQRYFQSLPCASSQVITTGITTGSGSAYAGLTFPQQVRATPTITLPSAGQTTGTVTFLASGGSYPATTGTHATQNINTRGFNIVGTGYSGLTTGQAAWFYPSGDVSILVSAEL